LIDSIDLALWGILGATTLLLLKLIAPLLGAILIMLGIIADRLSGIADR
jgi:hypothetical protein